MAKGACAMVSLIKINGFLKKWWWATGWTAGRLAGRLARWLASWCGWLAGLGWLVAGSLAVWLADCGVVGVGGWWVVPATHHQLVVVVAVVVVGCCFLKVEPASELASQPADQPSTPAPHHHF